MPKVTLEGSLVLTGDANPQALLDDLRVVMGNHGHSCVLTGEVDQPTTLTGREPNSYNTLSFGTIR